jgi:hypothetical protein
MAMAKRKRAAARSNSGIRVIQAPRAAAPIIKVSAPRAPAKQKRRGRRRHHGGGGGALSMRTMAGAALGGALLGFIEKQFPTLPTVPLIGRKGTIALIAYFVAKKGGTLATIARDVGLAAAAIAGNELGATGKVSGDVAPQVHGIASQV